MVSISNSNNTTALTLLRSNFANDGNSTQGNSNAAAQSGSEIISVVNFDAQRKAMDAIAKIVTENGGLFLTGGEDGKKVMLEGGDGHDYIVGAIGGEVSASGGAGDDTIYTDGGQSTTIDGGDGNDRIFTMNDVRITGGAGNDTIQAVDGNTIDGGEGDDTIGVHGQGALYGSPAKGNIVDGGAGNDTISGFSHNVLNGGEGNDRIVAFGGANVVSGGEGDDVIHAIGNDNTVSGGHGNDIIGVSGNNTIINFSIGDGKDTIAVLGGSGNTLKLGEGLNQSDMKISYEGTSATIRFEGHDEELKVDFLSEESLAIEFSDGESISIKSASEVDDAQKGLMFVKYIDDGGAQI